MELARRTRFPDDMRRANKTALTLVPEPPTLAVFFRSEELGRNASRKQETYSRRASSFQSLR